VRANDPGRPQSRTTSTGSWQNFSPNGRWLVLSSKSRSPYTQMYLARLDAKGNDSPAIPVDNCERLQDSVKK
jgi:hypothetical protein